MLRERLSEGVLCILTPLGPRYLRPSFWHRVRLLWIFRHFHRLPPQVLSTREQRFIEMLCQSNRFIPCLRRSGMGEAPVIGVLEHRIPVSLEAQPERMGVRRPSHAGPLTDERGSALADNSAEALGR